MKRKMVFTLLLIGMLVFAGCNSQNPENGADDPQQSQQQQPVADDNQVDDLKQSYCGTWTIYDCQSAEVAALSSNEANAYLNSTLIYATDSISLDGQIVANANTPSQSETYTEEALVENYHANLGEWWNDVPEVTSVSLSSDESFFGDQLFIVNDDVLWIYYEGFFFLARK